MLLSHLQYLLKTDRGSNMNLILNGEEIDVENGLNVLELLKVKGIQPEKVIVELNHKILKTEELKKTLLKENDRLEVLRFVGGG